MKVINTSMLFAGLVGASLFCARSMAQSAPVPDHPRENEVNQRLDNQQARIQQGVANGTLNGNQAARDERHVANIARRESVDEARHGGHITKGEQRRLNRAENRNSRQIYRQKHS